MDYFYQIEDRDGLRFSVNVWPGSKAEQARMMLPLGCMYSPLKRGSYTQTVAYEPLQCKGNCRTVLNPFCAVDFNSKVWGCPFCLQRNQFPANYAGISQQALPAELMPHMTTIEYQLTKPNNKLAPAFLFVVDLCLRPEELEALKDSILQAIDTVPQNTYVGLVTFGTVIQLWQLSNTAVAKSFAFNPKKAVSSREVFDMLGLGTLLKDNRIQANTSNNFIVPLSTCEDTIVSIIEGLEPDPFPVGKAKRPQRATGAAVSVAISVLENTFAGLGGRIMVFMGGPCSVGPGMVVTDDLKEAMRSHHEIKKELAPHMHTSIKFYEELADRVASNSHAVDLFSCSLDQTGLLEMKQLAKETGGVMVLADSFDHEIFIKSFARIFEQDEANGGHFNFGLAGKLDVFSSREIKVCGGIGRILNPYHRISLIASSPPDSCPVSLTSLCPAFSLLDMNNTRSNSGPNVSDTEVGSGGTNQWRLPVVDPNSTYAIFFEVARSEKEAHTTQNGMIQFQTTYQHPNGSRILRVTTVAHTFADPSHGPRALMPGCDQECCAALIARIAVWKSEREDADSLRFLDSALINVSKRYADFRKGDPMSFQLPAEVALYPQFMFYLRRGPLIQVFNNSPDETVFFRYCLLRETVSNCLIMIQPTLDSYTLDNDPQPVILSAHSIDARNVLLLDTFFHVVIHYGETIAAWRNAGYHNQPEYENLKELLEAPKLDAQDLMKDRLPLPMYVETDQRGSQARFLTASIDPAITHKAMPMTLHSQAPGQEAGQIVFTEDASLQIFIDKLKNVTVGEAQ